MDRGGKLTERQIEFFFFAISRQLKQEPRYKEILLSSLVRCVIVNDDSLEIQYNYKKELPTLANPVKVRSSHKVLMVTLERFERSTHGLEGMIIAFSRFYLLYIVFFVICLAIYSI